MIVYYLTIAMGYVGGYSGGFGLTTLPVPFATLEACQQAGEDTARAYNGGKGDFHNYACTPVNLTKYNPQGYNILMGE